MPLLAKTFLQQFKFASNIKCLAKWTELSAQPNPEDVVLWSQGNSGYVAVK
jgi:hypothetical protein